MNSPAYQLGQSAALTNLGFKSAADFGNTDTPYPHKSPQIPAERIALLLQQQDDVPRRQTADNKGAGKWDRPVSWSSPVNLSGLDTGAGTAGLITPSQTSG